jgi:hypothetical protein
MRAEGSTYSNNLYDAIVTQPLLFTRRIRVQFDDDVRTDIWIRRRDMVPEHFLS